MQSYIYKTQKGQEYKNKEREIESERTRDREKERQEIDLKKYYSIQFHENFVQIHPRSHLEFSWRISSHSCIGIRMQGRARS